MGEGSSLQTSPVVLLMTMKYTSMLLEVDIKREMCMVLVHWTKRFSCSTSVDSTSSQPSIVHQIQEMHEIFQKLIVELMEKHVKERTLEEKMKKWWKIKSKWWKIRNRRNSFYNTFKWVFWCQALEIILPMDIIQKTTLDMIVQMYDKFYNTLDSLICLQYSSLCKILTLLFYILCIEVHWWLAWLNFEYL